MGDLATQFGDDCDEVGPYQHFEIDNRIALALMRLRWKTELNPLRVSVGVGAAEGQIKESEQGMIFSALESLGVEPRWENESDHRYLLIDGASNIDRLKAVFQQHAAKISYALKVVTGEFGNLENLYGSSSHNEYREVLEGLLAANGQPVITDSYTLANKFRKCLLRLGVPAEDIDCEEFADMSNNGKFSYRLSVAEQSLPILQAIAQDPRQYFMDLVSNLHIPKREELAQKGAAAAEAAEKIISGQYEFDQPRFSWRRRLYRVDVPVDTTRGR